MNILPHGLDNVGHMLEVGLQKKGHRLVIAAKVGVLPRGLDDFLLWGYLMRIGEIFRLFWGKAFTTIWQHCVVVMKNS